LTSAGIRTITNTPGTPIAGASISAYADSRYAAEDPPERHGPTTSIRCPTGTNDRGLAPGYIRMRAEPDWDAATLVTAASGVETPGTTSRWSRVPD
jgi:hypothetical protein